MINEFGIDFEYIYVGKLKIQQRDRKIIARNGFTNSAE